MKNIIQLLSIFAVAIFFLAGTTAQKFISAQEKDARSQAEIELAEELEIEMRQLQDLQARLKAEQAKSKRTTELKERMAAQKAKTIAKYKQKKSNSGFSDKSSIEINGKKIDIEKLVEEHGKDLESWAEKHASEWEQWAERFESRMERLAKQQESSWEKWADDYSKRWEDWAEGLESGEFKPEEMHKLIDKNLEMLSEMPLEQLVDGALKEGLGELKNAPWESLGELHELVGGSIEQALKEMEKEIAMAIKDKALRANYEMSNRAKPNVQRWIFDPKSKTFQSKKTNLESALKLLQGAIESRSKQLNADSDDRMARITQLLENEKDIDKETIAKTIEQLEQRRAKQLEQEKSLAKMLAAASGKQKKNSETFLGVESGTIKMLGSKLQQRQALHKGISQTLKEYLSALQRESKKLKVKETEIEKMRREIAELRGEVEQMRKSKSRKNK